jgi:hypothetical protein
MRKVLKVPESSKKTKKRGLKSAAEIEIYFVTDHAVHH